MSGDPERNNAAREYRRRVLGNNPVSFFGRGIRASIFGYFHIFTSDKATSHDALGVTAGWFKDLKNAALIGDINPLEFMILYFAPGTAVAIAALPHMIKTPFLKDN